MDFKNIIELMNEVQMALGKAKLDQPIELPQIAVIGAQSTGKSSVLESIVGEDFLPRGRDIVTTCPLILTLVNRNIETTVAKFSHSQLEYTDFKEVHAEIERKMAEISGPDKFIKDEPIHLKVTGKEVPDLTLIDLPGFTVINMDEQNQNTSEDIQRLVMSYITQENTIILAISPANDDIANSQGLRFAQEVDPNRERTIGVLTKVDLMDKGCDACDYILNNKHALTHGYILVKCRSHQDNNQNKSIKKALEDERRFFKEHEAYSQLEEEQGIPALREKLHKLFVAHILKLVPEICQKIESNLEENMKNNRELGDELATDTIHDQHKAAIDLINDYCDNFKDLIEHGQMDQDDQSEIGGVTIQDIFRHFVTESIVKVDSLLNITNEDIIDEIRRWNGLRPGLFVPEDVCRRLIFESMDNFQDPILECANRIYRIIQK